MSESSSSVTSNELTQVYVGGALIHSCQYCIELWTQDAKECIFKPSESPPTSAWLSCAFFRSCLLNLATAKIAHLRPLVKALHGLQSLIDSPDLDPEGKESALSCMLQEPPCKLLLLRFNTEWVISTYSVTLEWHIDRGQLSQRLSSFRLYESDEGMWRDKKAINTNPQSQESLRNIRLWLDDCRSNHEKCRSLEIQRQKSSEIPGRLISVCRYVSTEVRLALVSVRDPARYAALSYCWGQDQSKFFTTLTNFSAREQGFTALELPRTMKDALDACLALGYEYLWVDALCIIQDCESDIQRELTKMAGIYAGADLVISAARANDSSEGFMQRRLPSVGFQRPISQGGEDTYVVDVEDLLKVEAPLGQRAWTLQEHRQAQRLIQYQYHKTIWHCSTHSCVDGGREWEANRDESLGYPSFIATEDTVTPPAGLRRWTDIIEIFTKRFICRAEDRLPAIAAFAREFARQNGLDESHYKAGIWLPPERMDGRQLLWSQGGVGREQNCQVSAGNIGPSWSWCSYPCSVWWATAKGDDLIDLESEPIKIDITLRTPSFAYGQVSSGRLVLRGFLQQVTRLEKPPPVVDETLWMYKREIYWQTDNGTVVNPWLDWDYPDRDKEHRLVVWFLPFYWLDGRGGGLMLGLDPDENFIRLGIFQEETDKKDKEQARKWIQNGKLSTVTIH